MGHHGARNDISQKELIRLYERSYNTMRIKHNGAAHKRLIKLKKKYEQKRKSSSTK